MAEKVRRIHAPIPIEELLTRTIEDLKDIRSKLSDSGRPFNERELELLRVTMIGYLREAINESIFFFASGDSRDAIESLKVVIGQMESIESYGR